MAAAALKAEAEPTARQRLADAVAALNAARDRLERLEAAFHEAGEASLQAAMALEAQEEAVRELAASASARLAARALGELPSDTDALAEAERALDEAQRRRLEAVEVRAALEAETQTQQQRVEWSERAVADAVAAALCGDPAVERLLTAYDKACGTVADLGAAIRTLPLRAVPKHHHALTERWDAVNRGSLPPDVPQAPRWRHAIEALRRGEDVSLPDVE
jgi:hypothetical protein